MSWGRETNLSGRWGGKHPEGRLEGKHTLKIWRVFFFSQLIPKESPSGARGVQDGTAASPPGWGLCWVVAEEEKFITQNELTQKNRFSRLMTQTSNV